MSYYSNSRTRSIAKHGEDYTNESVEVCNFDPDLDSVSKEIIVGPKNKVMRDIDDINAQYLTRSWISGNKSRLPILNPVGITPAFNWKRGYKQTLIECINSRFNQYEKLNGDLGLILQRRPDRMDRDKRYFISRIVAIDETLRQLRKDGANFHNQVEKAQESIELIKDMLAEQFKACQDFIENSSFKDKIEVDMRVTYPIVEEEYLKANNYDKNTAEVIKWQRSVLVFDVWFKDFNMGVQTTSDESLGEVPIPPCGITFNINLETFINTLQQKGELDRITPSTFGGRSSRHHISYATTCGFVDEITSYTWNAWYPKVEVSIPVPNGQHNDYRNQNGILHPFFNRSSNYEYMGNLTNSFTKWLGDEPDYKKLTGICFGNLESEVGNHLVKLDLVGLLITLQLWCRFTIGSTGPLNSINEAFLGMPGHYSTQFKNAVGKSLSRNAVQQTIHFVANPINGVHLNWLIPRFVGPRATAYNFISELEHTDDIVINNRQTRNRDGQTMSDDSYGSTNQGTIGIENLIWLEHVEDNIIITGRQEMDDFHYDERFEELELYVMSYDIFDPMWRMNKFQFNQTIYAGDDATEGDREKAEIAFKEAAISFAYAYTEYSDYIECQFRDKCHWYKALKYMLKKLEGEIPIDAPTYIEMLNLENTKEDKHDESPAEQAAREGIEMLNNISEPTDEQIEMLEGEQHNRDLSENEEDEIVNQMRTWVAGLRGGRNG
tara:strand:- start:24630 stop:26792 length:2163 start_codon:yes stop_codon:yes gene_type:complete